MKCCVIVFGNTQGGTLKEVENEYIKRITPFSPVEYIILPEEKMAKTVTEQQVKTKETQKFWKAHDPSHFLVACDVRGKSLSSPDLAKKIGEVSVQFPGITFVVGGSLGLSDEIIQKAHLRLSFSAMTFPHDLFRVFLFEQIYRSFMILGNRKYHR